MTINFHLLMAFIHVFLFVYAIGGDVAVHYIGKYITRSELSLEERIRVRDLRFIVDMTARSSLVLLLAVGFTLAQLYGSPITGIWLLLLWVADLAWLGLVWLVYFNKGTAKGARLQRLDMGIRYMVIGAMAAFGTYCLVTGEFIAHKWLAMKIILFAAILLNGVWIRRIAMRWQGAFDLVLADGDSRAQGEKLLVEINSMANRAAFLIWLLVVLMAFLGEVKPF
ncbi:MAG: hypothetical protein HOL98_15645 [Gammaproteobacteria bacterium]|nr:hypothetical protein [Gammaproteobacteria bacterium]MBT5204892.1 hypothetical protein [Gammaproteobacteria bacterium]MBT5600851.1 hypothetical protein [Gammaproteobacteria bacterium]MBT6246183.1 hypothetical protein [Gammaproteobacteria bacterium]